MTGRSGRIVLALVLGLSAPLGCMSWQYGMPQMMVSPELSNTNTAGELSRAQAAQLCRSAGQALETKGFIAEAIRQYENARQYDPLAPTVARRLAVLYDLQGDAARAEAEYQRALREQSGDADLLNDFGYFHYRHDRFQVAENWLRNAVAVNPGCQRAWINLGQVLARQGRLEESYRAFAQVLRPAEAYSNLGILLAKQGHTSDARNALQQAAALDPTLEQPRAFLKALPPSSGLLPANLTNKSAAPPALALTAEPSRAVRNAPPKPSLGAPPPLIRLAPTSPPNWPPLRIDPSPSRPVLLPPPPPPPPSNPVPSTALAAPSSGPIIVYGPIRTAPPMAKPAPIVPRPLPPPPPPPPPLIAPRSAVAADAPVILRTSASIPQTSRTRPAPAAAKPRPLPVVPSSIPLRPVPRTAPTSTVPAPPPQATLTDCQGGQLLESDAH